MHSISMRFARFAPALFAVAMLAVWSAPAPAQQTAAQQAGALPSARAVLEKSVQALGGQEAMQKFKSRTVRGSIEIVQMGLTGEFEAHQSRPDSAYSRFTLPGFGEQTSGYDGKVGWVLSPAMGPMVLEGRALEQAKREADFDSSLRGEADFKSIEIVERLTFEGTDAFKMKKVTRTGEEFFEYYAVDTGLQVGYEYQADSPMGVTPTLVVFSDYKDFDGIRLPMRNVIRQGPITSVISIKEVVHDKVDAAIFALPPQIRALTEKAPK